MKTLAGQALVPGRAQGRACRNPPSLTELRGRDYSTLVLVLDRATERDAAALHVGVAGVVVAGVADGTFLHCAREHGVPVVRLSSVAMIPEGAGIRLESTAVHLEI